MGKFVLDENIYILGKITEVDPADTTRYRIQTDLAKFYVTEKGDTLRSNPAEIFTASELYSILLAISKMSSQDVAICFGQGFTNLQKVMEGNFSIEQIRTMYREWQYGNQLTKGDMVYYRENPSSEPIVCMLLSVKNGSISDTATDNEYILYNDQGDIYFTAERNQITSAHKRSAKVIEALDDIDKTVEEARKEIE